MALRTTTSIDRAGCGRTSRRHASHTRDQKLDASAPSHRSSGHPRNCGRPNSHSARACKFVIRRGAPRRPSRSRVGARRRKGRQRASLLAQPVNRGILAQRQVSRRASDNREVEDANPTDPLVILDSTRTHRSSVVFRASLLRLFLSRTSNVRQVRRAFVLPPSRLIASTPAQGVQANGVLRGERADEWSPLQISTAALSLYHPRSPP